MKPESASLRINYSQIRLGNYICLHENGASAICQVTAVSLTGLSVTTPGEPSEQSSVSFEDVEPVTLTPDILGWAGFHYSNVRMVYENAEGFVISNYKDGAFYCPFIDGIEAPDLRSLHGLQNLHFMLTGRELPFAISERAS